MQRIPTFIEPMEDELLYSYLLRLAKANGYDDYPMFHRLFIAQKQNRMQWLTRSDCLRYDSNFKLMEFFNSLEHSILEFNSIDFFRNHSFYCAISPLMTDYQQTDYINWVFDNIGSHSAFSPAPMPLIKHLMFCPECREEELKKYECFGFHRVHQMPDMKVCPIHKTPLCQSLSSKGNELADFKYQPLLGISDIELEYAYSSFVQGFVSLELNANAQDLKRAISNRRKDISKAYGMDDVPYAIEKYINDHGTIKKLTESALNKILSNKTLNNNKRVSRNDILLMIFALFEQPSDIQNYLIDDGSEEILTEILQKNDYIIESEFKKDLIRIKHNNCGKIIITTPDAIMKGWFCPDCDAHTSNDDFIRRTVSMLTDGEYEVLEPCVGLNQQMKVFHKKCHQSYLVRPNAFIQLGSRCSCLHRVSYEDALKVVETDPDYKLISFEGASVPMTILHLKCNHTFSRLYSSPKIHVCPFCIQNHKNNNARNNSGYGFTHQGFASLVEDLVGSEYTLLTKYSGINKPVEIRHNVCGNVDKYYPFDFKRGCRCKQCTPNLTCDYIQSAVSQISGGLYHAEPSEKKNYYIIKDQSNNIIATLFHKTIMQELLRPTPSSILPLEKRYSFENATA